MEITLKVNAANRREGPGRLDIRADDPALTPHAGLALTGELCRRLGLTDLIDAELGVDQVCEAEPAAELTGESEPRMRCEGRIVGADIESSGAFPTVSGVHLQGDLHSLFVVVGWQTPRCRRSRTERPRFAGPFWWSRGARR